MGFERLAERIADEVMWEVPEGTRKVKADVIYNVLDKYSNDIFDMMAELVSQYLPEDIEVDW